MPSTNYIATGPTAASSRSSIAAPAAHKNPGAPVLWKKRPRFVPEEQFQEFLWGDFRVVVRHLDELQKNLQSLSERIHILEETKGGVSSKAASKSSTGASSSSVAASWVRVGAESEPPERGRLLRGDVLEDHSSVAAGRRKTRMAPSTFPGRSHVNTRSNSKNDKRHQDVDGAAAEIQDHLDNFSLSPKWSASSSRRRLSREQMARRRGRNDEQSTVLLEDGKMTSTAHLPVVSMANTVQMNSLDAVLADRLGVLEKAVSELEKAARGSTSAESQNGDFSSAAKASAFSTLLRGPATAPRDEKAGAELQPTEEAEGVVKIKKNDTGIGAVQTKQPASKSTSASSKDTDTGVEMSISVAPKPPSADPNDDTARMKSTVPHPLSPLPQQPDELENKEQQQHNLLRLDGIERQQQIILEALKTKVTSRDDGLLLSRNVRTLERTANAELLKIQTKMDKSFLQVDASLEQKASLQTVRGLQKELALKADMKDILVLLEDVAASAGGAVGCAGEASEQQQLPSMEAG
ncbi:unnamed protein product [Amoebophrya sp. A120]|nr:unnamed protein product [Amoebophrya sp. A120]|eukprot:GSA120T00022009001.1